MENDFFWLYITAFVFGNDVADFDKRGYIFKRNEIFRTIFLTIANTVGLICTVCPAWLGGF